ncbi:MAG: amidase [Balneolales bacterium]|nr:amidase [Balneolales bacterium]
MLKKLLLIGFGMLSGLVLAGFIFVIYESGAELPAIETHHIEAAETLSGLHFSDSHRDSMLAGVRSNRETYQRIRAMEIGNEVWPAVQFNPHPANYKPRITGNSFNWEPPLQPPLPENMEELAFFSVADLSSLIRSGTITSTQLTELYLKRLREYNPKLQLVITLTDELAMKQAARADSLLNAGIWLGPLHGIPFGSKDLLALDGYPTTWGATPYKNQYLSETATVLKKLEEAGAVHLAKLSLGALAWGDVWFDGVTKTPWNTDIGASGSSAGSGAAVAGGLAAFALGTETLGSIVSPATRNGVTGLRPTYGRVSRYGAMALSWSMDKIGPMTRTAEDAALVLQAIYGPDGLDPSVAHHPFYYEPLADLSGLRIGYHKTAFSMMYPYQSFDESMLEIFRDSGAELVPIELPEMPFNAMDVILSVEAAAAFDELTRSGQDSLLVRQMIQAWPNVFRTARFVPAVEYIQANRARTLLIEQMHEAIKDTDIYITPSFVGGNLLITNLTGHPSISLPNGFDSSDMPVSFTINGHLYDEGLLLAVADYYQRKTNFHRQIPPQMLQ